MRISPLLFIALMTAASSCQKDNNPTDESGPNLNFQFKFAPNQVRLNNLGQISNIPQGHAAQTPDFHRLSVHYIELAPTALTQLGSGAILYKAPETTAGGENAIDFNKADVAGENEVFTKISLKNVPPGTYQWVRASVAYQNYDIRFNINNVPVIGDLNDQQGTVASFLGFNTYITDIKPRERMLAVNDDKKQGFWVFETALTAPYNTYDQLYSGQAPAGATTVVNPLGPENPVPPGSCVITGQFAQPLVVTGQETGDITVTLSFSINKSFEWVDSNGNGKLDFYADQSAPAEQIVDMGLRGLVPSWQ